jgi:hypothetical protein
VRKIDEIRRVPQNRLANAVFLPAQSQFPAGCNSLTRCIELGHATDENLVHA